MQPPTKIADSEWEVMRIVWDQWPVTVSQIVEQLADRKGWHSRTTRTLIDRLAAKGAITYEVDGKRYLYRPKARRQACIRQESRDFLDRVFGGEPASMLVSLVKHTKLAPEDISRLKRILDDREK